MAGLFKNTLQCAYQVQTRFVPPRAVKGGNGGERKAERPGEAVAWEMRLFNELLIRDARA